MMKMKRMFTIFSAAVLSAGMLLPHTMTASAANEIADTLPYNLYFEPQRTLVSAEEVAAGDVVIPMPMYLYGSTANRIGAVSVKYSSSSDHVFFRHMVTGATVLDQETSYETSYGTLTTKYMPYCFGMVGPKGKYSNGSAMITTKEYACDPIYGSSLYSTGDGRVKFTASYKPSKTEDKISKEFICDVTLNEDGSGTYSFDYIDQTTYLTRTISAVLPRYDATLPEGEKVPDAANSLLWIPFSKGADFLGNTSNEFPLFQVDVVVEKDTPCGIYNISFNRDIDVITGADCQLIGANQEDYRMNLIDTSIAVGVESAVVTSVTKNNDAVYASHDTHVITGADFATQILADITFEDGSTQQNVDITNLVSCNGASPADLYKAAGDSHFFASDVPLCIGNIPVKRSDGSDLTQHILVGLKGDINFNGEIDTQDAFQILMYYSVKAVGQEPIFCEDPSDPYQEKLAFFMADIDTCSKNGTSEGEITMNDAFQVLMYTSHQALGSPVSWDSMMK